MKYIEWDVVALSSCYRVPLILLVKRTVTHSTWQILLTTSSAAAVCIKL